MIEKKRERHTEAVLIFLTLRPAWGALGGDLVVRERQWEKQKERSKIGTCTLGRWRYHLGDRTLNMVIERQNLVHGFRHDKRRVFHGEIFENIVNGRRKFLKQGMVEEEWNRRLNTRVALMKSVTAVLTRLGALSEQMVKKFLRALWTSSACFLKVFSAGMVEMLTKTVKKIKQRNSYLINKGMSWKERRGGLEVRDKKEWKWKTWKMMTWKKETKRYQSRRK